MFGPLRQVVPDFIRRRYALKFGIALLVLAISVGALGYVATAQLQEQVKGNVNDNLGSLADQEASALQAWNERHKNQLKTVAASPIAKGRSVNSTQTMQSGNGSIPPEVTASYLRQTLTAIGGDTTGAVAFHVVDFSANEIIASSKQGLTGSDLDKLGAPWSDGADIPRTGVNSSEVYRGPNGEQRIAFLRTIVYQGRIGNSTAIVYVAQLSAYQSQLAPTAFGNGTVGMAVNGQGTIIVSGTGTKIFANYPENGILDSARKGSGTAAIGAPTGAVAAAATKSGPGSYSSQTYVAAYAPVEGTDWVLVLHFPTGEVYGFVKQLRKLGLLITFGSVMLVGLIGAILGRNTAAAIDRLTTKTEQMEEGNLDVDFETRRIDNIGRLYEGFANMRDSLRNQIEEAREAREEAEQAREEAERMTEHLEMKADEYRGSMQQAAEGDLTQRLDPESESEAMTDIAEEFNEMLARIEETMEQLKSFANEVATSSEEVTASSEEVRSASQQVTESIQEISDGAERQNESLQSVQQEMDSLSTTTEEIAASSNEVADIAERTAETGREGRDAANEAIDEMRVLDEQREEVTEQMRELEREVDQIDELIDFISEIAEQTNMLALNANIEASRSGGEGEGFSVVAQEVKELAEETKDAADDIEERLERIQAQTQQSVEGVEAANEQITEAVDEVERTVDALEDIADYAQETNTGVQEISAATEEQAASTEEVVAMVDEAATISEETTAEAENVAAAAEQQTTALTEVSNSASELADQASRLSAALDRFDTDAEGTFEMPAPGEGTAITKGIETDAGVADADGAETAEEAAADQALEELGGGEIDADLDSDVEEGDADVPIAPDGEADDDGSDAAPAASSEAPDADDESRDGDIEDGDGGDEPTTTDETPAGADEEFDLGGEDAPDFDEEFDSEDFGGGADDDDDGTAADEADDADDASDEEEDMFTFDD